MEEIEKIIHKPEEFVMPTDSEIMNDVDEIFKFLRLTHPFMLDRETKIEQIPHDGISAPNDIAIEIRALRRHPHDRECSYLQNKGYEFGASVKLYTLEESNKKLVFDYLKEKYTRCVNGDEVYFCLYYSVFSFDDTILKVNERTGKQLEYKHRRFNCLAKNNAKFTQILIADFDNVQNYQEFQYYKTILKEIGIGDTLDISSGNGYQVVWLLDEITDDKDIITKTTETLITKGFEVDGNVKDCARIMRLAPAKNCKGLSLRFKNKPKVLIDTKVLTWTETRYSLDYIFSKLEELETQDTEYARVFFENKEKNGKKNNKKKKQIEIKDVEIVEKIEGPKEDATVEHNEIIEIVESKEEEKFREEVNPDELQRIYKTLDIEGLPIAVRRMLLGFREGKANNMVYFLTQFFKTCGYNKIGITDAILTLAKQDKFNYEWDDKEEIKGIIDRAWNSESTPLKVYTEHLRAFGYIDFEQYYKITVKERVKINNKIFEDLKYTDATEFYIYICLIIHYARFGSDTFTVSEIIKITGLSDKTVRRHIKKLLIEDTKNNKKSKVYKTKANSTKLGDKHQYSINHFIKTSKYFTSFHISTLDSFCLRVRYKELNERQLALCLYLRYRAYIEQDNCIITQSEIAKDLGISRPRVSTLLKPLEEKGLIKMKELKIDDYRFIYEYILQY